MFLHYGFSFVMLCPVGCLVCVCGVLTAVSSEVLAAIHLRDAWAEHLHVLPTFIAVGCVLTAQYGFS